MNRTSFINQVYIKVYRRRSILMWWSHPVAPSKSNIMVQNLWQGLNRIDSFWFANFWFAKVNQKSQKDFDSRGESFYFWLWSILIHFDFPCWFDLIHLKKAMTFYWLKFWNNVFCFSTTDLLDYMFWNDRESWFTCESKSNRIKNQR